LCFSPDGKQLAASGGAENSVSFWDVNTRKEKRWKISHWASALAFSPEGGTLAVGQWDARITLWDLKAGKVVHELQGHQGPVMAIAYAPGGKALVSGSPDQTARWWDPTEAPPLQRTVTHGHTSGVNVLCFSPEARWLVSASTNAYDRSVRCWDLGSKGLVTDRDLNLEGALSYPTATIISPDGKTLAVAGGIPPEGRLIQLREFPSGRERTRWKAHEGHIHALVFTPDGRQLLSASDDKTLKLWDVATRQLVRQFTGHTTPIRCLALSPDGRLALSGAGDSRPGPGGKALWEDCSPRLWDVASGQEIRRLENPERVVLGVAFSPDGRRAAAAGSMGLLLWDLDASAKRPARLLDPHRYLSGVAFSPDGQLLFSQCSYGPPLSVREAESGRKLAGWNLGRGQASQLAVASDSRHVALGMNTGVIYLLRLTELKKN
jgi:WD40 repeat protein